MTTRRTIRRNHVFAAVARLGCLGYSILFVTLVATVLVAGVTVAMGQNSGKSDRKKAGKPAASSAAIEAALRDFEDVARVLLSPRCRNCHPAGERPLQRDQGVPHAMNISRRSSESGLPCTACHRDKNATFAGGAPGVPGWRMPTADTPMVFEGRSVPALCEQLRDPERNGGRDLDDLVEHVGHDALVVWAWTPGEGRTPPPVPFDEFVARFTRWAQAGGPCPRPE